MFRPKEYQTKRKTCNNNNVNQDNKEIHNNQSQIQIQIQIHNHNHNGTHIQRNWLRKGYVDKIVGI